MEEQEAKVNSLQAAYQNLQAEYDQLIGKQDLRRTATRCRKVPAHGTFTRKKADSAQKPNGTYQKTRTVLQLIDKTHGSGYSNGIAADLNRTQEQRDSPV